MYSLFNLPWQTVLVPLAISRDISASSFFLILHSCPIHTDQPSFENLRKWPSCRILIILYVWVNSLRIFQHPLVVLWPKFCNQQNSGDIQPVHISRLPKLMLSEPVPGLLLNWFFFCFFSLSFINLPNFSTQISSFQKLGWYYTRLCQLKKDNKKKPKTICNITLDFVFA